MPTLSLSDETETVFLAIARDMERIDGSKSNGPWIEAADDGNQASAPGSMIRTRSARQQASALALPQRHGRKPLERQIGFASRVCVFRILS